MEYLYWICYILYIIIDAIVMIKVVMDNRQPAKTMAWILVLWAIPVIGILLYIFFGQNTRKERLISERSLSQLTKRSMFEYIEQKGLRLPESHRPLMLLFKNQSMALPFKDNDVTLYTSGYDFFPALLHEISLAQHHIHIDIYIFEDDELGNLIADALIDRAEHGVEVRVIYDDVGCWNVKDKFFKEMSDAGIEVHAFLKVAFPVFTSKVNYRNHRKIVVIDGKVGFMGGMNIADRYTKGTSWGTWRDTHFKIIGKGVHGLQAAFLIDWYVVSKKLLNEKIYYPPLPVYSDDNIMQICTSGPVGQWRTLLQAAIFTVANAKKYVFIQTPYFLPTEGLNQALQIAALGGVDVRLMLPKRSDTRTANMATHSFIDEMVKAGVKVYFYKPGFLHSKLMVADDELTCIGSANMDFRSFEHNFEVNAFIYDTETALQMREIFLQDQRECVQVFLKNWVKRPWWRKAAESVVRLMAPLL